MNTKKLYFLSLSVVLSNQLVSQTNFTQYSSNQESIVSAAQDKIVTDRGLNYLIAERLISFLSNDKELSLKKGYATVSSEDETFNFGYNLKNKTENGEALKYVFSPGLKMDFKDHIAPVFSAGEYNDNLSISLKASFFKSSYLFFDDQSQKNLFKNTFLSEVPDTEKDQMEYERGLLANELRQKFRQDSIIFENSFTPLTSQSALDPVKKTDYLTALTKKYADLFHKKEAEILEEKEYYNAISTTWLSLGATLPLAETEYKVSNVTADFYGTTKNYNAQFFVQGNYVRESKKYGKFFLSIGYTGKGNSTILTEQMTEVDKKQFKPLTPANDSLVYETNSGKAYLGQFKSFFSNILNFQLVYYPPKSKYIGVRASLDQYLDNYHPSNIIFGLPIKLPGKEDDTWVNIEPQIKFKDVSNTLRSKEDLSKRIIVGITVGLPFSSVIY